MSGPKVYVVGRLRGLTQRRLSALALANGLGMTRRPSAARFFVLAHSAAGAAVSDDGELRLAFRAPAQAALMSERAFRARLGLAPGPREGERPYSLDQIARHAGLTPAQAGTLSLFDVLCPCEDRFSYADLATARAVGKLFAGGARFPRIIAAALALDERGERLSSVRVAETPWGDVVRAVAGGWARCDDGAESDGCGPGHVGHKSSEHDGCRRHRDANCGHHQHDDGKAVIAEIAQGCVIGSIEKNRRNENHEC